MSTLWEAAVKALPTGHSTALFLHAFARAYW